jgi:hypothetical protein
MDEQMIAEEKAKKEEEEKRKKKKKQREEVPKYRDRVLQEMNKHIKKVPPSPLVQLTDVLEEASDKSRFVGDTMFWKYFEDINIERIYHTDSVEYLNLKLMCRETVFFFILLAVFTAYTYSVRSSDVYHARVDQINYWSGCGSVPGYIGDLNRCSIDDVDSVQSFWEWMQGPLVQQSFTHYDYMPKVANLTTAFVNNGFSLTFSPRFIGPSRVNVVLGSIRLRQLRVKENLGCEISKLIRHVYHSCYGKFSNDANVRSEETYSSRFAPTYILDAFKYSSQVETKQRPMRGQLMEYAGDGFMIDLPNNDTDMHTMVSDLWQWRWWDRSTRAIVLEVTTLNINTNVLVNTRILFEFDPTGTVSATVRSSGAEAHFFTWPSIADLTNWPTVIFLQIVVFILFLLAQVGTFYLVYKTIRNFIGTDPIKYMRRQTWGGILMFMFNTIVHYLGYGWNFCDWIILIMYYCHVGYRIAAYLAPEEMEPERIGHPMLYMPVGSLMENLQTSRNLLTLLAVLMWVRPFKYICMIAYFRRILRIMEQCVTKLGIFSIVLIVVVFAFSVSFFVGFGAMDPNNADLGSSFLTLCFLLLEGYDVDGSWFRPGNLQLMPLLFLAYIIVIYMVLLNIFIAVVLDVYATSPEKKKVAGENPMFVFLKTYYNTWTGFSLVEEEGVQNLRTEDLSIQLKLLPGLVRRKWIERKRKMQRVASSCFEGLELFPGDDYLREDDTKALNDWSLPSSKLELNKMRRPEQVKPISIYDIPESAMNEEISRSQLQRLMNEDETLPLLLNDKEAVKVIRRFKQVVNGQEDAGIFGPSAMNPEQVKKLQGEVFKKIEDLETFNTEEDGAPDVPKIVELTNKMSDAVHAVRNDFRIQLTHIIEATATLFEHLVDLTKGIDECRANHNEIIKIVKESIAQVPFEDEE